MTERLEQLHATLDAARQEVRKSEASIVELARVRRERLPEVDRWIAQASGTAGR